MADRRVAWPNSISRPAASISAAARATGSPTGHARRAGRAAGWDDPIRSWGSLRSVGCPPLVEASEKRNLADTYTSMWWLTSASRPPSPISDVTLRRTTRRRVCLRSIPPLQYRRISPAADYQTRSCRLRVFGKRGCPNSPLRSTDKAIWHIASPDVCDGTSAVGESRHCIQAHPHVNRTEPCLSEQIGARLREADEGSDLAQPQPAPLNRQIQTSLFGRRSGLPIQERPVDLLDWMRPSCTASTAVAISRSLGAAVSGSE